MEKRNLEDVDSSIKQHNRRRSATKTAGIVLMVLFFPLAPFVLLIKHISMGRLNLSAKTTLIFSSVFAALISVYLAIILAVLYQTVPESNQSFGSIIAVSVAVGVLFTVIGTAAAAIITSSMLRPVRVITDQLAHIDGDSLSTRLKTVDAQEEIVLLARQINLMLSGLEQAFERQSHFVADASHELKTPLSVIAGYSDLLMRWGKDDPAVLSEGVETIKRESTHMAKIIDQMLLLAKLGRLNMHKQSVNISALAMQIVEGYKVTDVTHSLKMYGDAEVVCSADKTLLTEAIRAIIDNAIKYTPCGGSIMVIVEHDSECHNPVIRVRDSGVGIDSVDLPFIFDRFYRCDKTRGREKGSAGLGLTICKTIVEMMDGDIFVKSSLGEGSEFTIKLFTKPSAL